MQNNEQLALSATITEEYAGRRLDQALARLFPEYSRERLKGWVLAGDCKVDGLHLRPRDKVQDGQEVIINTIVEAAIEWQAEDLPLDIVYEDEDLIVVNKPVGMVVHPAAGNYTGTLVNALLHHDSELSKVPRAGIVHRLDKDTSGLLVVARNLQAHTSLVTQLQERSIKRIYETIVHGIFVAGGTIDAAIDRHPKDRKRMAVDEEGKHAVTHYRLLNKFPKHTHLQVQLETGRTHQIRVHMAHVKHPIVGDKVYASRMQHNFSRQALHAKSLGLIHPRTEEQMSWEIDLPNDMQELIGQLQTTL